MGKKNTYYYRTDRPNYPEQLWWVAGTSDEFDNGKIVSRRILDVPVALYRNSEGNVVALEDSCPHRGAPLSVGTIKGDNLVCGYHGLEFAADGGCVNVPTQTKIPKFCRVRTFPVVENAPFVWIWTGNPDQADPEKVPDYAWHNNPEWTVAMDYIHLGCNYMMLKENVIDLTHFAFVHASSFEMDDDYGEPPECIAEDGKVSFRQEFMGKKLPGFWDQGIGLDGKIVDRVDTGTSLSPAEHVYTQEVVNDNPGSGERPHYAFRFQHMTTPETAGSHHYWWVMARDHGLGAKDQKWMKDTVGIGFEEDKVLLELIQDRINANNHPEDAIEISIQADQPSLQTRLQAERLIDLEQS
jgi:phenylpropionate dioxygenase-like ring-hydroxylating dioxygenase large terminal subunit